MSQIRRAACSRHRRTRDRQNPATARDELGKGVIVSTASNYRTSSRPILVNVSNPKNEDEAYSFQISSVYNSEASQQDIFDNESK